MSWCIRNCLRPILTFPSTLFWAGDTFAPKLQIQRKTKSGVEESVGIQRFLQDAYLDMWQVLAEHVGHLPGVLGFEV